MISVRLARALADSGLVWSPASGDRFLIDRLEAEDDVYTVSDMTIEAHTFSTGTVLGFNGTTEWAMDSVAITEALWLPREDQLRVLLGPKFGSLEVTPEGFVVYLQREGCVVQGYVADTAEDAYASALLEILDAITGPDDPTD